VRPQLAQAALDVVLVLRQAARRVRAVGAAVASRKLSCAISSPSGVSQAIVGQAPVP
jgi:hypothetical protein